MRSDHQGLLFPLLSKVGTESIARCRVAPATATGTGSARRTTTWSGSAGATRAGSARAATSTWRRTAATGRTTTTVSEGDIAHERDQPEGLTV